MCAIAHVDASSQSASLMHLKKSMCHFCLWHLLSGTSEQRKWKKTKTPNLIVDSFSLTFVNLSLAWMLYFHVWCQNIGKFLVLSEYYNQFDKYQPSCVSFLEPQQSNLSNPGAYLKPCQTSNMDFFAKTING